jgi:hypothetical protein
MLPLEKEIVEKLQKGGPCCLDDVVTDLPNFSWGEIFIAVDRMSREGRVLLRQSGYSTYQLSLGSQFAHSSSPPSQTGQTTRNVTPIPQVAAL